MDHATSSEVCGYETERGRQYIELLHSLRDGFANRTKDNPIFRTDAEALFDLFLEKLPPDIRQEHNCNTCRHFVDRFGGIVVIDKETGNTEPVCLPVFSSLLFYNAIHAMTERVRAAKVTGQFFSASRVLGTPVTGPWRHFSVELQESAVHASKAQTAGQRMAERVQDYQQVIRFLGETRTEHLQRAVALLKAEALYRSEKLLGAAEWLLALKTVQEQHRGASRQNLTWLAIAKAHTGFCHPRAGMIGTLLEDIASGLPQEDVARRFADKMRPDIYQRPQAAPTQGAIAAAEKLVENLGITRSLRRRFARIEECELLWSPAPEQQPHAGVFGHLTPKGKSQQARPDGPVTKITFEKFRRNVLPDAAELEVLVPSFGDFVAMVTAADSEAPPILQWDFPDARNPVSHYRYVGSSPALRWNVSEGWKRCSGLTLAPWMWRGGKFSHRGTGAVFLLPSCVDTANKTMAIFPETLRSELHGVRAVIEAHSHSMALEGAEQASACGISERNLTVRTTDANGTSIVFQIDRWD